MFVSGPIATNSYLVEDEDTGKSILVDAPHDITARLSKALKGGANPVFLVDTHGHWDHVAGNSSVKEITGAPICIHSADAPMLEDGGAYGFELPFTVPSSKADRLLGEGDRIEFGSARLEVMHTPGHTEGGICLHDPAGNILFSGDTLFDGAYGRTDLPNSSPEKMIESLARLSALPPATRVYPGHGGITTIGEQEWL